MDEIPPSEAMGLPEFFDAIGGLWRWRRPAIALGAIASLLPWESFRADIETVVLTPEAVKKSKAGRKSK